MCVCVNSKVTSILKLQPTVLCFDGTRDPLCKALYTGIYSRFLNQINRSTAVIVMLWEDCKAIYLITVLDILKNYLGDRVS